MRLKIDFNQCCGCRRCEVACSLHHYENTVNPKKSRIRIFSEEAAFYPVVAGPPNNDECTAKNTVVIGDKADDVRLCGLLGKPWRLPLEHGGHDEDQGQGTSFEHSMRLPRFRYWAKRPGSAQ